MPSIDSKQETKKQKQNKMKKIMFNNHYGLTKAVIKRIKNKTRRLAPIPEDIHVFRKLEIVENELRIWHAYDNSYTSVKLPYKVGEIVAIAQSYKDAGYSGNELQRVKKGREEWVDLPLSELPGWTNKMFTYPTMMTHQIRFTDVRVERLQDISDEDCLAEGIYKDECKTYFNGYAFDTSIDQYGDVLASQWFKTPQAAYAVLIDKISGKGTWQANPWVLAYTFELVK